MYIKLYRFADTLYRIIGSVVFQVTFSETETKRPRLKEKYTNSCGFDSIKNTIGKSWLHTYIQAGSSQTLAGTSVQACPGDHGGTALSCFSDLEVTAYEGGRLSLFSIS